MTASFQAYIKTFVDKDGKVWSGGRGIPVPENSPHLLGTTPEIENLRPKSPVRSQPPPTVSWQGIISSHLTFGGLDCCRVLGDGVVAIMDFREFLLLSVGVSAQPL